MKRSDVAVRRIEVEASTIPTDAPRPTERSAGRARRSSSFTRSALTSAARIHLCGRRDGDHDRASAPPLVEGGDALAPAGSWEAMVRAIPTSDVRGSPRWRSRRLTAPCGTSRRGGSGSRSARSSASFTRAFPSMDRAGSCPTTRRAWASSWPTGSARDSDGEDEGRDDSRARTRTRAGGARARIGPGQPLFVDANGAYTETEAIRLAASFAVDAGVTSVEEPVSSDDLRGLAGVRLRAPAGWRSPPVNMGMTCRISLACWRPARSASCRRTSAVRRHHRTAAGRCARRCALATAVAARLPLGLHLHPALALSRLAHLEYFHDHVDRAAPVRRSCARRRRGPVPDSTRSGNGMEFKRSDAQRFAV